MIASKPIQLSLLAVVGLVAARSYFQWVTASGALITALHSFGEAGYWLLLAVPAFVLFLPFFWIFLRQRKVALSWIVTWAVLASLVVAYLGLFGEFLFCAFISRATCV